MEESIVYTKEIEPIKIKLIKGQKDSYGWELSAKGKTTDEALEAIGKLDHRLRQQYCPTGEDRDPSDTKVKE